MFRCGWQAFVALSSSAMVLAFGQSCSSADSTTYGPFESERNAEGCRSSGGDAATTGGRNGSSGGLDAGGRPNGGSDVGAGGELADGGEVTESGGRGAMGGRGSGGGRGGKVGGGAAGRGTTNGGSAGELSGGGTLNEGGFGGSEPSNECDDDDLCTVDEPDTQGVCHFTPKCIARSACEVADCNAGTGECQFTPIDEGATCDDQQACTTGDLCANGSCVGVSADLVAEDNDARPIPDGAVGCGGDQPLTIDFEFPEGGVVTAIEVSINVDHPNLANLSASILHVQSNREAVLFSGLDANGLGLSGRYLFASGWPSFVEEVAETAPNQDLKPERYTGFDDLASSFSGDPVQGTWRLSLTDLCVDDVGNFFGADLRIKRVCEQP